MMKYISAFAKYSLLPLVLVLASSCGKDFLDLKPY